MSTYRLVYTGLKTNLPQNRGNSFYLCTDTQELYFGNTLYSGKAVLFFDGGNSGTRQFPSNPTPNTLYIDTEDYAGFVWNPSASPSAKWEQVITSPTGIQNAIIGDSSDTRDVLTIHGTRALANDKVELIAAGNGIQVTDTTEDQDTSDPDYGKVRKQIAVKLSANADNELSISSTSGEEGLFYAVNYQIRELATPSTGAFKTYALFKDGTQVALATGENVVIDIPKDFLVKSASLNVVTAADKAEGGKFEDDSSFAIGDKYIDFVVNTKDGTGTAEHIYLNVNDLVDAYTAGDGLGIGDGTTAPVNEFYIKLETNHQNGLAISSSGLRLNTVTPAYVAATGTYVSGTTYYTDRRGTTQVDTSSFVEGTTSVVGYYVANGSATNGAMTSADKSLLDTIWETLQIGTF